MGAPTGDRPAATTSGGVGADRAVAFRRLAERHLDGSYRLAAVILGDGPDAQDAVHDAFVTAWLGFGTLRERERFEAWFGRILVNTCRDRLRRRSRWPVRDISSMPIAPADDPTARVADRIVVRRALCQLKPDDRILLALRYYRDLSVDDVAAALGIAPRAAASRLHRALGRLRGALDGAGGVAS